MKSTKVYMELIEENLTRPQILELANALIYEYRGDEQSPEEPESELPDKVELTEDVFVVTPDLVHDVISDNLRFILGHEDIVYTDREGLARILKYLKEVAETCFVKFERGTVFHRTEYDEYCDPEFDWYFEYENIEEFCKEVK